MLDVVYAQLRSEFIAENPHITPSTERDLKDAIMAEKFGKVAGEFSLLGFFFCHIFRNQSKSRNRCYLR